MATAAKSTFSHYDALQVRPSASDAEIERAFATQMRLFRLRPDNPLVHLARLNMAYRTLRDPLKRKAYDAAIGFEPMSQSWTPTDARAVAPVQFVERGETGLMARASRPEEAATPEHPREMRVASFIAQSLRQPAADPAPEAAPDPLPASGRAASLPPGERRPTRPLRQAQPKAVQPPPSRARIIAAAAVAGFAMLAMSVAVIDRNPRSAAQKPNASSVTSLLPAPTGQEAGTQAEAPTGVRPQMLTTKPARDKHPLRASRTPTDAAVATEESATASLPDAAPATLSGDGQSTPASVTEVAATSAPVATQSARLPLSNATISRTIEHIGYACGQVVSVTPAQGADSNVYKVHCSSGDVYRATPLGGRYHFRRLAGAEATSSPADGGGAAQTSGNEP